MKRIKVPYLKTLDVLDLTSIGFLMEEKPIAKVLTS